MGDPVEWLQEPTTDAYGTVTIGSWGGWSIQICPMLFNDRLVLTPEACPLVYDYGWCYPKGGAAELAARAWDPATQAEPIGYIKAVMATPRRAGETADA
jgi:hypothetical protein